MSKNIVEMINALNTQHKYAIADAVNSIETSSGARNAIADAIHNIEMSGGDSGIFDIETGEWTPESDVVRPTIPFANHHDKMPVFIAFQCMEDENKATPNTQWGMYYFDYYQFFNPVIPTSTSANNYGIVSCAYRSKYGTSIMPLATSLARPSSDPTSTTMIISYPRFYTSENEFYPNTGTTKDRYWKAGFHHKWIALWLK